MQFLATIPKLMKRKEFFQSIFEKLNKYSRSSFWKIVPEIVPDMGSGVHSFLMKSESFAWMLCRRYASEYFERDISLSVVNCYEIGLM